MDMKLKVAEYIAQAAQQSFENCALTGNDVSAMIETPPDKKMGDYALPCFRLSKVMRCAPQMIAGKLAEKVACEEIDHVEVVGGYLNVFLRRGGLDAGGPGAVLLRPVLAAEQVLDHPDFRDRAAGADLRQCAAD